MNYSYIVPTVDDVLASEVLPTALFDKVLLGWKPEYGDLIDFGGGVYDVKCATVIDLCSDKPSTLRNKLQSITLAEAKTILQECNKALEL